MEKKNRTAMISFFISTFVPFLLVYFGLKYISGNLLSLQNTFLLLGFCILVGIVSALLYYLNLRTAYYFFNSGILVGLFEMYRHFLQNLNGWEDLAGLASLFIWILIGLCSGLFLQSIRYLYIKYVKKASK